VLHSEEQEYPGGLSLAPSSTMEQCGEGKEESFRDSTAFQKIGQALPNIITSKDRDWTSS